jgi:hypothetical protein
MGTITINGQTFTDKNINVSGNKVIIDGIDVTPESKEINISILGSIEDLKVSSCNKLTIDGSVGSISTQSGDVEVTGDITGDVKTMSGDVNCSGNIGGSVKTMSGDIKYRK